MNHPTQTENQICNYYLLQRLVRKLNEKIPGSELLDCLSLNKKELVLVFSGEETLFTVKFFFGEESIIFFPGNEIKPGRYTKNIFNEIIGKTASGCEIHPQDRSFRLSFEDGFVLVFMMYGKNGNALFYHDHEQVAIFRKQFESHPDIKLSDFDKYKLPEYEEYSEMAKTLGATGALKKLFRAFSPSMIRYLQVHEIETKSIPDQWNQIKTFEDWILGGPVEVVHSKSVDDKNVIITFFPFEAGDKEVHSTMDIMEAVNLYANRYFYERHFRHLKGSGIASLKSRIIKAIKQLESAQLYLQHLELENNYKHQADVLMANLHAIPAGSERIKLFDFYAGKDIEIALKRDMNPQLIAEKLYRKSKNQIIEKQKTIEKIEALQNEIPALEKELLKIETMDDYKELKSLIKVRENEEKNEIALPYRHFSFDGFDIYAGKSAANNDKLTFGFAHKDDLWLHARDVSGSHVIVKHKQKAVFPQPVIEKAAKIAAYYSKNKGSTLSPVIYTLRKYVRKPKGAEHGTVICEQEKMIIVEPGLGNN